MYRLLGRREDERERPMRREHMEDMAKLYAPAAARSIRNKDWDQAAALLLERCQRLDMALQSLTPGGSEYVGDPDRCVAYVNEQIKKGREGRRHEGPGEVPRSAAFFCDAGSSHDTTPRASRVAGPLRYQGNHALQPRKSWRHEGSA